MIIKTQIQETSGDNNSVAQTFYQNIWFTLNENRSSIKVLDVPQYKSAGGTKKYYDQDRNSVFVGNSRPHIEYIFTSNTSSFSDDVKIVHDIYKIDYKLFNAVSNKLNLNDDKKSYIPTIDDINDVLKKPLLSITANTSDIISNKYDLFIDQYSKNTGSTKFELFEDKSQFFVDTKFVFENSPSNSTLFDYQTLDSDNKIISTPYSALSRIETFNIKHKIDRGEFKGVEVVGDFFSYFKIPDKPIIQYPSDSGDTKTSTISVFWSNSEEADEYLIQVTYNDSGHTFSGEVFSYIVEKKDKYIETYDTMDVEATKRLSSSEKIRKYQLPIKNNSDAQYRVGNVKVLTNIFGVKQTVVSFSNTFNVKTPDNDTVLYVFSESDSPYVPEISGLTTPPSIVQGEPIVAHSISGIISGGLITGATVQLTYSDSNFITKTANINGSYTFDNIQPGNYTISASFRGYDPKSANTVVLNNSVTTNVDLELMWDNTYDLAGSLENYIIKY